MCSDKLRNQEVMKLSLVMSDAGLAPTHVVDAVDEYGERRQISIAGERPLTIYLDRQEIVTLMTLGSHPEALVLGYLRNQALVSSIHEIKAVQVDWETEAVAVVTHADSRDDPVERARRDERLSKRTVTTGCGQGTMYGDMLAELTPVAVPNAGFRQSDIYALLANIAKQNDVYKKAGAVHGCALCAAHEPIWFVEDVGRHNAVDAIAGMMWLNDTDGTDKVFYTTGRLTSEMVIKVARIGVPLLISRSGVTEMGRQLAESLGVTMISRAKGKHFLVVSGATNVEHDAVPAPRALRSRAG